MPQINTATGVNPSGTFVIPRAGGNDGAEEGNFASYPGHTHDNKCFHPYKYCAATLSCYQPMRGQLCVNPNAATGTAATGTGTATGGDSEAETEASEAPEAGEGAEETEAGEAGEAPEAGEGAEETEAGE